MEASQHLFVPLVPRMVKKGLGRAITYMSKFNPEGVEIKFNSKNTHIQKPYIVFARIGHQYLRSAYLT